MRAEIFVLLLLLLCPEYLKYCLAQKSDSINIIVHVQDSYRLNNLKLLSPCVYHFQLYYTVYTDIAFFFFGCAMWDLSSLIRDQTHAPGIGSTES